MIILANEIPFVGDDPESIQEKAKKVDFLKDHWPYNLADLVRILDLCFTWKSQGRIPEQKYRFLFHLESKNAQKILVTL